MQNQRLKVGQFPVKQVGQHGVKHLGQFTVKQVGQHGVKSPLYL